MSTITEFRSALLQDRDPGKTLQLVDDYLAHASNVGSVFALPDKHKAFAPVVRRYANDLEGGVKFVHGVREELPGKSAARDSVHRAYRVVFIRLTQQQRRVRLDTAVTAAVKKGLIEPNYDSKMRYLRKCTQAWTARRAAFLDLHRRKTEDGRLTLDEQEDLLTTFWAGIDREVERGVLPKP